VFVQVALVALASKAAARLARSQIESVVEMRRIVIGMIAVCVV